MCQILLNACIYAKQKINLTWPKNTVILCRTNNIPTESPCDIVNYIVSIGSLFLYFLNIIVLISGRI